MSENKPEHGKKQNNNGSRNQMQSAIQNVVNNSQEKISALINKQHNNVRMKNSSNTLQNIANQNMILSSITGMMTTYLTLDSSCEIDIGKLNSEEKNIFFSKLKKAKQQILDAFPDYEGLEIINNDEKKTITIPFILSAVASHNVIVDEDVKDNVGNNILSAISNGLSKELNNNSSTAKTVSTVLGVISVVSALMVAMSLLGVIPGGVYLYVSLCVTGVSLLGSMGIKTCGMLKMASSSAHTDEIEFVNNLIKNAENTINDKIKKEPLKVAQDVIKIYNQNQHNINQPILNNQINNSKGNINDFLLDNKTETKKDSAQLKQSLLSMDNISMKDNQNVFNEENKNIKNVIGGNMNNNNLDNNDNPNENDNNISNENKLNNLNEFQANIPENNIEEIEENKEDEEKDDNIEDNSITNNIPTILSNGGNLLNNKNNAVNISQTSLQGEGVVK